jgi:hypothetical protein
MNEYARLACISGLSVVGMLCAVAGFATAPADMTAWGFGWLALAGACVLVLEPEAEV